MIIKFLKSLIDIELPFTVKSEELMVNTLLKMLSRMPIEKLLINKGRNSKITTELKNLIKNRL